nr:claudin-10-like [Nothobranchius furzeri]
MFHQIIGHLLIRPKLLPAEYNRPPHINYQSHRSSGLALSSMFQEIAAFVLTTSGWVLVSSTLPTDYWKVSSLDGTVITTATYWSNLWKTCVTDSTGVSNCKDFPSMLALDGPIFLLLLLLFK